MNHLCLMTAQGPVSNVARPSPIDPIYRTRTATTQWPHVIYFVYFIYLYLFYTSWIFLDMLHNLLSFSLQNAVYFTMLPLFGSQNIHILHKGCPKIETSSSTAKGSDLSVKQDCCQILTWG
jgi:uncharacterized membrane protein YbjE (DUF340 family)